MKKSRIVLTAIAVVGVVGGVMAFNAKTPSAYFTCGTDNLCSVVNPVNVGTIQTTEFPGSTSVQNAGLIQNATCASSCSSANFVYYDLGE